MTKADLVARIAQGTRLTKRQSTRVLDAVIGNVQDALRQGDHVTLVGFGTFSVRSRGVRKGRHPRTGQEIFIPPRRRAKFSSGKRLREAVK
jgi:DNA-binding protein HU-beta